MHTVKRYTLQPHETGCRIGVQVKRVDLVTGKEKVTRFYGRDAERVALAEAAKRVLHPVKEVSEFPYFYM